VSYGGLAVWDDTDAEIDAHRAIDGEVLEIVIDDRAAASAHDRPDHRLPGGEAAPCGVQSDSGIRNPMGKDLVIHCDPEILGGTPVFVGTRVPLRNLIDYLERGHGLYEFLDNFPSVSREQAVAALEAAHEVLALRARPAR